MKRVGDKTTPAESKTFEPTPPFQPTEFNYETEQAKVEAVMHDAVGGDDPGPVFLMDDDGADNGMTLNSPDVAAGRGFTAANQIERRPGEGFKDTREVTNLGKETRVVPELTLATENEVLRRATPSNQVAPKFAVPATKIDLENLDESMILNLPSIKAATFEVMDMLNLKPVDKTIRFRWANFKNNVAGNLARYYALGYKTASIDDVDQTKIKVDESMIDGTQVKYFDIILLKIPVIRLMELYKANIIKSVNRLVKFKERGIKEANRQFMTDLAASGKDTAGYNRAKAQMGGREPVEFFVPGAEESTVINQ